MFDRWLDDYEASWCGHTSPPSLLGFLHNLPNDDIDAAPELALIDLEQRWRLFFPRSELGAVELFGDLPALPTWADYCRLLPGCELNWIEGICHEFRVRQSFGDRPNYRQMLSTYPSVVAELAVQLPRLAASMSHATISVIHDSRSIFSCRLPGRLEIGRRRLDEPAAPALLMGTSARLLIADHPIIHISRIQCRLVVVAKGRIYVQHVSQRGSIRCSTGEILSKTDSCELPLPCWLDFHCLKLRIE